MQKSDDNIINLFEQSNPGFQRIKIAESMKLKRGGCLNNPHLAYETWGKLTKSKDNVVVIFSLF